ncbi:cobalamin biosynthesis protein CbiX [Dactylosporangium vinaceum]|uniref:Sirohydrochlorin chelatase n=1 Tax=Dactylosporangium vinaceum TaxID=53362 RepID=A0ABV5M677_9ACTN|nr:CbiX/SirB N-terminal domain-containing protein [Dactylosporangium vinaceum]UAB97766.1 cobalamin biosynthesis protein CbiX [Dactylosporangium vinaceum]
MTAVLLVAHGSSDPRAAAATRALARAVAAQRPGLDVRCAFLDHAGPRPGEQLASFAALGHRAATVVPLLLTNAYHGRFDLPAALDQARADTDLDITATEVLGAGAPALLLSALRRLLPPVDYDGVVLAAAGTRDDTARHSVDEAAAALGATLAVPCAAAYASASPITGAVAVAALRAQGCRRIAVSSYFLAPGKLHDIVVASAVQAGALEPVAAPLCAHVDVARLVLARIDAFGPARAA